MSIGSLATNERTLNLAS